MALSILFRFYLLEVRGEQAPVTAQLALLPDELGNKTAEIILNGQSLGTIQNFSEEGNAKLSEKQTIELLTALKVMQILKWYLVSSRKKYLIKVQLPRCSKWMSFNNV